MKMPLKITRKEKGQSLVELALVFSLLLLLITGIIDLGSMYYTYTALQDTAQEGAIYASIHPTQPSLIASHIKESANAPIDTSNLADISVTCSGAACITTNTNSCQGKKITISVGYTYNLITPIIPVLLGRDYVVLKVSVTDTILQSSETIAALSALPTPQVCP
jgi:Flp pilus assembly protein TadG